MGPRNCAMQWLNLVKADVVHRATIRIHEIERDADAMYSDAISLLFDGSPDPINVLRWKNVDDRVENLIDMVHHTGNVLGRISVKYL